MPLIDLSKLRPGDVILETGVPAIADGTVDGIYGHASVALGRLVRIQVGKDSGVEAELFEVMEWSKDGKRLVGCVISGDDVVVRRPKNAPCVQEIMARAMGELGRPYASAEQLSRVPDLTDVAKRLVERAIRRAREPEGVTLKGRYCSEVVAVLLGLPNTELSPTALSRAPELEEIEDVIVPEIGWVKVGVPDGFSKLKARIGGIGQPIAESWAAALAIIEGGFDEADSEARGRFASELEKEVESRLKNALMALKKISLCEPMIFHEHPRGPKPAGFSDEDG